MKAQKIFFLLLFFLTITTEQENLCEEYIKNSETEEELTNQIELNIKNLKKESSKCIESLVLKSKYKSLETYVKLLNKHGIKFRSDLSNSIENITNNLEKIMKENKFEEPNYKIISPAFQWAQSLSNIYIDIKYSFRLDSPGCLEINNLNVDINENKINLIGNCVLDDSPIKFELNLNCLYPFDKSLSSFKSTQGRYYMTLKKKEDKYWERLLSDPNLNISNMKIWYEMKNKFKDELKSYEKNNDDDDEKSFEDIEREYLEKKKKKKGKKKKKKRRKKKKKKRRKKKLKKKIK